MKVAGNSASFTPTIFHLASKSILSSFCSPTMEIGLEILIKHANDFSRGQGHEREGQEKVR